ncbi:cyclodeaminase [Fodinicurvata fenggangensis]|uniref:cyclodeaminase n=1 Tax=Fodinicurvata fenggangensis TaxID=1121830 RepID=UPI00047B4BCB|nr:cyclodeaminase [Fodinicurvata fenggangensis]
MSEISILSETDLRALVPLDAEAVDCVEEAFSRLAGAGVVMPPVMRLDIEEANGEVDVKTAYVPGLDSFAIKMSPGFFDNPKLGLPSLNGLMVVFSARTGLVEALLLDNGYLTDVRTAAAGAVAARHLAPRNATQASILGAGVQARLQLQALTLVRNIARVSIWARRSESASEFAEWARRELQLEVDVCNTARQAVDQGEVIVTTTPSREPLIEPGWLRQGQHVTAMGSDSEHKNEISPNVFLEVDRYVCDRQSQCALMGELHHALEAGVVPEDKVFPELGAIVSGREKGRESDDQITLCDLTGTGVQDTAIATLARKRAVATGAGASFTS